MPVVYSEFVKRIGKTLRLHVFPRPFEELVNLRGKTGAEVGVLAGDHAASLLHQGVKFLYLVDPYLPYVDFDKDAMEKAKRRCKTMLRKWKPNIAFLYETSGKAAELLPELDFVYIDAAHDYENVKADIAAWWPKVRSGGMMGGHDYDNARHACHDGVVDAVTEFASLNGLKLMVESPDWWIEKP